MLFWMLAVGLLALEVISLIEMCLLCHLPLKMSMKPRCNLHLKGEYQPYQQSWAPRGFPSPVGSLMLFTVPDAGFHGTLKVCCCAEN